MSEIFTSFHCKKQYKKINPEAFIDLHAHTEDRAFYALLNFLEQSHNNGHKWVLVITGIGSSDNTGLLKRAVPRWLQYNPRFYTLINGYCQARLCHGGDGAIYVKIKKQASQ